MVRQQCVRIFDQLVDEESLPDLIVALDDQDPGVRTRALTGRVARLNRMTRRRVPDAGSRR